MKAIALLLIGCLALLYPLQAYAMDGGPDSGGSDSESSSAQTQSIESNDTWGKILTVFTVFFILLFVFGQPKVPECHWEDANTYVCKWRPAR